jgi:hypothetical protein
LLLYSSHLPLGVPNGLVIQLGTSSFLAPSTSNQEQMQQMMEAQAQLMQVMTQFLANANNNNNNNNNPPPPPPPQVDMLAWFLRLRPAKFSRDAEPLEAMD